MTTALVLHLDGDIKEINLPADAGQSRAAMCKAIGCRLLDVVALTSRLDMWIDDEGLYDFPVNPVATALARHYGFVWQGYHGPVVLCSVDTNGNSIDLNIDQVRAVLTRLMGIAS